LIIDGRVTIKITINIIATIDPPTIPMNKWRCLFWKTNY